MYVDEKKDPVNELTEQCTGCGACSENCFLLKEIDQDPGTIAARGAGSDEAFACSLCNMCEAVCPLNLSPAKMFELKREEAVANAEIDIDQYRYLFPDRPVNVMSLFREVYKVDYTDLNQTIAGDTAFFPGCTMMSYSPDLCREVFRTLSEIYSDMVFFTDCCGKPLYQLGLESRGAKSREQLREKISRLGIKRMVVACPNCYYELRKAHLDQMVELITIYEVLKEQGSRTKNNNDCGKRAEISAGKNISLSCTVHDSCPDRFEGVFGKQVREALEEYGYRIIEMEHSQQRTLCCGSGGQISHFRPDFAEELVKLRLKEAEKTGADQLVAYCHSCVLNFGKNPSGIKVRHVLNLLLDFEEDYSGVKNKAREMLEGPGGEENWEKIMQEAGEELYE